MIAKIDVNGSLLIKRKGVFRKQYCPLSPIESLCGDWCPRFDDNPVFARIIICGNEIDLEVDERKEFATTPGWIAKNLPEEAIGGGFTSRFVLVSGTEGKWLIKKRIIEKEKLN